MAITDGYAAGKGAVYLPEQWYPAILPEYESSRVIAPLTLEVSRDVGPGDTVHVPKLAAKSASSFSGLSEVSYSSATEAEVTIVLDEWYECSTSLADRLVRQSGYGIVAAQAGKCAEAVAVKMEQALASLYTGISTTDVDATAGLTSTSLRTIMKTLDQNNAPQQGRVGVITPTAKYDLFAINEFISKDYRNNETPFETGLIGEVLGMDVYMSTNLQTSNTDKYHNLFFVRQESLGLGLTTGGLGGVEIILERLPGRANALGITAHAIYGAKTLRGNGCVDVLSS